MKKYFLIMFMLILSLVGSAICQSVSLEPYGVSPRDADQDTTDMFDVAYNGLLNVGVETQMYFKGVKDGARLTSPGWTVTQKPQNSMADFTTVTDMDTSTQVAAFQTDSVGVYVIEFADEGQSATLTIHAGLYVGIEDGSCNACHSSVVTEWEQTGHYSLFEEGIKGEASDHYASHCISCHVTGYDTNADNDGFDDREFVFPDSLYPAQWDTLNEKYPDAMKLARVQCESCHGPGNDHFAATDNSKMVSTLSSDNCAWCHDSGSHHVYPEQWDISGHANPVAYPTTRAGCVRCHSGQGFVQFTKGEETTAGYVPITCASCHDPHSVTNEHQVRTVEATLANDMAVQKGGTGKLCMNCHQSRREANSYSDEPHSHYGPHYVPQADMLIGTNAVTFGKRLPSSAHFSDIENGCVDCHMEGAHVDEEDNVLLVGGHSFQVVDDEGNHNVVICEDCHGDVGTTFADKKYYYNGNADHDGDDVEEGVQMEVAGLMEELAAMLPAAEGHDAYDPHDDVDETWTRTELKAAYNYEMVYYDGSHGLHNPAFTVALLKVSIRALENSALDGEIVAIDDVPNDQGKQVKIIWDKFADDGVAVDPVETYKVKRYDAYDDVWTDVGETSADGSMRYAMVVPTVFDSTADETGMTTFQVVAVSEGGNIHASTPAEGYSVDNLIPHAPVNTSALVAENSVDVSWEAPDDPDINYYIVYRSETEGFIANEETKVGTTTELYFTDSNLEDGTYFYKVAAVDFSGNRGVLSTEVSGEVTAIGDEQVIPTEFALQQNYPNPFNPGTTISFALKQTGKVKLTVYNSIGQMVQTLINEEMNTGNYSVNFNAANLSSGVYFYRITVTDVSNNAIVFEQMRKMILMK